MIEEEEFRENVVKAERSFVKCKESSINFLSFWEEEGVKVVKFLTILF